MINPGEQYLEQVLSVEEKFSVEIGNGERGSIALALETGAVEFLTDDEAAYQIAEILGLDPKGTLYILVRAVKEGDLSVEQAKEHLRDMLEEGFWLSPGIIHGFHIAIDRMIRL